MLSATEDRALSKFHFFSTDDELFYEPFYADFGPLNLGATYRFCQCDPPLFCNVFVTVVFRIRLRARRILNTKLNDPELSKKCIVYYSSLDPQKRSNSVTVIGVYAVYYLRFTPDEACKLVSSMYDPLCSTRPEHTTSHVHAHRSAACAQRTLRIRRHLRAYTRAGALVRARLQWGHTRPSGCTLKGDGQAAVGADTRRSCRSATRLTAAARMGLRPPMSSAECTQRSSHRGGFGSFLAVCCARPAHDAASQRCPT